MRDGSRRVALVLASAALAAGSLGAVGTVGCGDDEDSGDEVTIPEISTPSETEATGTATAPGEGGVTTAPDTGGTGTGGTTTGGSTTTPEDTATSDTPPPPGSPEEAFEKQCEKNPAACG